MTKMTRKNKKLTTYNEQFTCKFTSLKTIHKYNHNNN